MISTNIPMVNFISVIMMVGASFGLCMGNDPMDSSAINYIEKHQKHIFLLPETIVISLVIISTLVTIASAFLQRKNKKVFIALLFAALFLLSFIFITWFCNRPIQIEIMTWDTNALPENWTMLVNKLWNFNIIRTIAAFIATVLVAWTFFQNPENN